MIVAYLSQWEQEKQLHSPSIQKAIAWLQSTDLDQLAVGRHPIDEGRLYALVSEYLTEPQDKRRAEAHQKYVDVQYLVNGTEKIGVARLQPDYEVLEDKLVEKDVIFYNNPVDEVALELKAGMFAILFPWEVHRPNCACGEPSPVRKVVMKISVESLS